MLASENESLVYRRNYCKNFFRDSGTFRLFSSSNNEPFGYRNNCLWTIFNSRVGTHQWFRNCSKLPECGDEKLSFSFPGGRKSISKDCFTSRQSSTRRRYRTNTSNVKNHSNWSSFRSHSFSGWAQVVAKVVPNIRSENSEAFRRTDQTQEKSQGPES